MLLKKFKLACVLVACQPRVELIKITKQADEGRIRARWRVVGALRFFPFGGERSGLHSSVSRQCVEIMCLGYSELLPLSETILFGSLLCD